MNQVNCADCVNSYDGADSVLRCRLNGRPAAAACEKFEREKTKLLTDLLQGRAA